MALSPRNHLKGEVTEVALGTVTALITVKVGANVVESVITKLARPSGYSRSAATSTHPTGTRRGGSGRATACESQRPRRARNQSRL